MLHSKPLVIIINTRFPVQILFGTTFKWCLQVVNSKRRCLVPELVTFTATHTFIRMAASKNIGKWLFSFINLQFSYYLGHLCPEGLSGIAHPCKYACKTKQICKNTFLKVSIWPFLLLSLRTLTTQMYQLESCIYGNYEDFLMQHNH